VSEAVNDSRQDAAFKAQRAPAFRYRQTGENLIEGPVVIHSIERWLIKGPRPQGPEEG